MPTTPLNIPPLSIFTYLICVLVSITHDQQNPFMSKYELDNTKASKGHKRDVQF